MKMSSILSACAILFAGATLIAQDANTAELQTTAAAPEIQQQFDQPDGAAIFLKEDGSFQILARGTGVYDFDDPDDLADARNEGNLKARAALAKFMKERLINEEGLSNASKKVKALTTDGKTQTSNVTKETIKKTAQVIRGSSDAILKGVITLKEQKIPRQGTAGEIQVTVGISSKTLYAAGKLVMAIDAVPEQGQTSGSAAGASGTPVNGSNNKAEVRQAVTDF